MRIALLIGEIAYLSYHKMILGLTEAASAKGDSIILFTCEGWKYEANTEYEKGEYQIFRLPDFQEFDAVILDVSTINDEDTKRYLLQELEESLVPFLSIGLPITGGSCLSFDNFTAMTTIVDHLIEEHHLTDIHYISGTRHNMDSKERYFAYTNSMKQHNLVVEESMISVGNFEYAGGYAVVDQYLRENRPLPQAFVCANDLMAIGAIIRLDEAGIRVPEDIIITGYDNSFLADQTTPRLTTIDRREYEAGTQIYESIVKLIVDHETIQAHVAGTPIFRESCGCCGESAPSKMSNEVIAKYIANDHNVDFLKDQSIEFSSLDTFVAVINNLRENIKMLNPGSFYLCLCGNEMEYREKLQHFSNGTIEDIYYHKYTDEFTVALAYIEGQFVDISTCPRNEVIPRGCIPGMHYITMPVHYRNDIIGFCVLGTKDFSHNNAFFQHLVLNLNNALAEVSKRDMMQVMINHMNNLWVYDELTKLLNRSGFRKEAPILINKAAVTGGKIGAVFIDLDNLKKVNDSQGHEVGDTYILAMSNVLRRFATNERLIVRYGGDEFVILTIAQHEQELNTLCNQIEYIASQVVTPQFTLSASTGFALAEDTLHLDLDALLTEADDVMYANKKAKKMQRT